MSEISGLHAGDRVRLITELYKVYSEFHTEPFDKFYFWGEMLLTDFDTIDKYRIDAQMLFRNISEIKELEADVSYLTPRPVGDSVASGPISLDEEADLSEEKRRFLAVWQTLGPVYRDFRAAARVARGSPTAAWCSGPPPSGMPKARFRLSRAAAVCRGGIQRSFGVRESSSSNFCYTPPKPISTGITTTYYKDNPDQEAGMFVR